MFRIVVRLRVVRPYDGGGALRRVRLEVDGREVARLKQYRSVDLELAAGRHTVVGHMDWAASASRDVDLVEGEVVELEVALPLLGTWELLQRPQRALQIRRL